MKKIARAIAAFAALSSCCATETAYAQPVGRFQGTEEMGLSLEDLMARSDPQFISNDSLIARMRDRQTTQRNDIEQLRRSLAAKMGQPFASAMGTFASSLARPGNIEAQKAEIARLKASIEKNAELIGKLRAAIGAAP